MSLARLLPYPATWPLVAVVVLISSTHQGSSQAGQVTYMTPGGATTSGGAVSATASFVTTQNSLQVTLTNQQSSPTDIAQLISGLSFTVANGSLSNVTSDSLTAAVSLVSIAKNNAATSAGTGQAGYVFSTANGATTGTFDVLPGSGAGPAHLIIGMGPYPAANGSIAGSKPHNPFIGSLNGNGTATFTLTGASITSNTVITSARFAFGTTEGSDLITGVPTTPPAVATPEPSTWVLAAAGLGFLGCGRLRHRRTKPTVRD